MKKIIILISLFTTSCLVQDRIYYSKNQKKSIHNLETMMRWLQEDYANGDIPKYVADNYILVLQNTRCSLYKKQKLKHKDCAQ